MVKISEKALRYSQWQEIAAFPKRQQNWRLSSKWEDQKSYDARKILSPSSILVEKPIIVQTSSRYTRLHPENSVMHPHQDHASWLFDARKLNHGSRLRNILPKVFHENFTTKSPRVSVKEQKIVLLRERDALLNFEDAGTLSEAQAAHLHWVEAHLDYLEDQDPVEQEADRRLAQTSDKLDEILSLLRSLPRKAPEGGD